MEAIDIINRVGRWLVPYLARLSLELAILAGVVLLAILVLRLRSARLRHVFWGLVLAKPVVAGVLRPEVLLPESMARDLSEQQLRLNVAHESAHARRKDNAVLLEDAVADFEHIADNVAGHRIETCVRGADEDVYPQPYCYLTTMLIQMHAAGWEDADLDTLAAVSGASAMFGYQPGEFAPKYAFQWRNPNKLVAEATGYSTESVRAADAEAAWKFVKESVDSGRPVSGWHGELMLLAGYRDADAEADRQVFAMKDGNGYFAEWWGWEKFADWVGGGQHLSRYAGRVEPRAQRDVALRVIRDLIGLSTGAPDHVRKAFPKATFGPAGIEAWAADCADMEKHEDWGMCHPENPQWTVRNSTATYLGRVAEQGLLGAEASDHVRRASEGYRAAYRSWQEAYALVGYPAPDGSGKVREKRLAAAEAVRQAAEHERKAIAELRLALRAEAAEVPPSFAQDAGEGRSAGVRREDGRVWIEDLQRFPSYMTQPGGYVACSRYLGLGHSADWIYGGSGFAFALNVHRVLCPSGPTAWREEACNRLAGNLGLRIEGLFAGKRAGDFAEKQAQYFRRVQEAIDAGLPVIGWEMGVPDYYVGHGYDEEGNYLFRDFDGSVGHIHHTKLGDTGIGLCYLMIVRPQEAADERVTVRQALEFALEVAEGEHGHGGEYATGLAGYDRWIAALAEPETVLADDVAGFGMAYNAACWAECRRHAVGFLREARERLDDDGLREDLDTAIGQYDTVARNLSAVSELFPFELGADAQMRERLQDTERRSRALEALRTARDAEARGIEALARIADALGEDSRES